jgi:iron complex outermembrane receptor protein
MKHPHLTPLALALATLGFGSAQAQTPAPQTIVVTGSLIEREVMEAPYAVDVVDAQAIRAAGPMVNASEALQQVPGLIANNRSNYAQDLQISSRGFGARAGFGVRGIRLYTDGIPASGPDGQGQVSHFDLASAQHIEVLRGPFSALNGSSSGGVISIVSNPVRQTQWNAGVDLGSFGFKQLRVGGESPLGNGLDLRASLSSMEIDGFRPQSAARKTQAGARLGWKDGRNDVVLSVNHLNQPADDPLGLDRAEFDKGEGVTTANATAFDTRKDLAQTQFGLSWKHRYDEGALREARVTAFAGQRSVTQWLAIAAGTQANPRHGGGVIDFDRSYGGLDLRTRWSLGDLDLVAGVEANRQSDDRQGYENFTGTGAARLIGVTGAMRRDEVNKADTRDLYLQGDWALSRAWTAIAGVRHGRVEMSSSDRYIVAGNPDDSGSVAYNYTNPVVGLRWNLSRGLNLHASVARGYETPTLNELSYRPDGTGGFNTGLQAQTSRQFEIGAKWRAGDVDADVALFDVRTDDEIGVATNAGGRQSFQNVGRTQRRGIELGMGWRPTKALSTRLASSWLDATYLDTFQTCSGIPCNAPAAPVNAGNRIAGTAVQRAYAEVLWNTGTWGAAGLEWRGSGQVATNDRNTEFAPGYGVLALRWSKPVKLFAKSEAEWLVRVDNLLDRHHAGSVIVNEANGRFYEPAAPRSVLVGLRVTGQP